MRPRRRHALTSLGALLALALAVLAAPAAAQGTATLATLERKAATWDAYLDRFEQQVETGQADPAALRDLQPRLQAIEQEARAARDQAGEKMEQLQAVYDALGPPPAEGQPPESAGTQRQRAETAQALAAWRARAADAEVALTRLGRLQIEVAASERAELQDRLAARYPAPVTFATWRLGLPPLFERVLDLSAGGFDWLQALLQRPDALIRLPLPLLLLGLLLWGGRVLLRRLQERFGRQDGTEETDIPYPRRLIAAVVEGLATYVYPTLFCSVVWFWLNNEDYLVTGRMLEVAQAALIAIFVFLAGWALPRAMLSPEAPAWRLAPILAESARALSMRIGLLAAVLALDVFLLRAGLLRGLPAESVSLYLLAAIGLQAAGILYALAPGLWQGDVEPDRSAEAAGSAGGAPRFWSPLRVLVRLAALIALIALAVGYVRFGEHVVHVLLYGGLTIVMLFVLRGLLRYLIGVGLRASLTQRYLFRRHLTRNRLKFWLRLLLDIAVVIAGLLLIALIAGLAPAELRQVLQRLVTGFEVGATTVRPIDTLLGLAIFALALAMTRTAQRALSQRLLPRTQLDAGVQNSITSGLGYAGFALAVMLGVATMGLDLTNIALIAGALSVGIGFGLQNVVNNFVSGMILLIERPVKVGDWVVVGGNEGFVKQINVRATELETFQRASVIIPNAELISSAVVNWTHKDRHARIEVAVGVAYGSDVEAVRQLLLAAAKRHVDVLAWPEPFVLFLDFADSALLFELRCFTADAALKLRIASDLRFEIDRMFREEGIEIPFPQRVVHLAGPPRPDGGPET